MKNNHVERKSVVALDSAWTKNISVAFLNNKSHRIVFTIIIICMTAILFFSFYIYSNNVHTVLEESAQSQIMEYTDQSHDIIKEKLNTALSELSIIANSVSKYDTLSNKMVNEILNDEIHKLKYNRMSVSEINGDSYSNDGISNNVSHRDYFKMALKGEANVSNPITSIDNGETVIIFAVPIYKDEEVIGVLRATNSIDEFQNKFSIKSVYSDCETYVVKGNGELIIHPKDSSQKLGITNLFEAISGIKNDISPMLDDIQNNKSNVKVYSKGTEGNKFVSYASLNMTNDWHVVCIVSQESILQKADYIIAITIFLMVIIAITLLLLFFYVYYIKRSSQKTFEYLAYTDSLTGCRSWPKFSIDATELFRKGKDKKFAYVYLNIENFKYFNDIMGFEVGNDLLKYISKILNDDLAPDEPFTRINADRFSFIMQYESDSTIIRKLEQINQSICMFKSHSESCVSLNVLFGIYKIKDKSLSTNTMNDRALLAINTLSKAHESNYGFYNSSIRQRAIMEKELESEMQSALDNRNFVLYLQPKFDLSSQKIIGAEALVRWIHPKRGLIPPSGFIELFENNGFIVKLDYFMFEETCILLKKWLDNGNEPIPISVNISRVHLYNPNLAEELYNTALKYHIPTRLVEIELTESMDFENMSMLLGIVERLKRFEFTISIDDFGTGYSSLNMLKDLPVDILKIDREFFSEAADQQRGRQVIASIIDMAKRLEMKTVAEGVELKEQADFLTSINCDFVQGFYYSQPIGVSSFEEKYINKKNTDI